MSQVEGKQLIPSKFIKFYIQCLILSVSQSYEVAARIEFLFYR